MFLPLILACEREVEVELPVYEQKLVVNGIIDNISPISVAVSHSVPALQLQNPEYLQDAIVMLYGNNAFLDTLDYDVFYKKYFSSVLAQQGVRYKVTVNRSNYKQASASTVLPGGGITGHVEFEDSTGLDSVGLPTGTIRIIFDDAGAEKNYYRLNLLYYNSGTGEFQPFIYETDDPSLLGPEAEKEPDASVIFDDLLFNGQTKQIEIRVSSLLATSSPKFLIDFSALGEEYYKYRVSLRKFRDNSTNFFAEPVFVYTNIENGLGIFAAQVNRKDTIK